MVGIVVRDYQLTNNDNGSYCCKLLLGMSQGIG